MRIRNYKDKFLLQKTFVLSFLIILIAFFFSVNILLKLINDFFITDIEKDSVNIARNYVNRIADATESLEIINNMLDEKLMVTVKSITNIHHNSSISEMIKIAYEYNIDEINVFNEHGEIYMSNDFRHIGWKTYEEHPTYFFMNSFKKTWLEDIRKDTLSDSYYKYGYYKADDGCFVQVGIISDKYYNLIKSFEIHNLISELSEFSYIISAHFIDNDYNMIACNNIGDDVFELDASKKSSIIQNKEYYNKTKYGNEDTYEVMIPVIHDNHKIGTLAIAYSLSDTLSFIKLGSAVGVAILMLVFSIIGIMLITINKRNNKLLQLAYFDPLTELPNKDYLDEFLKDSVKKSANKAILLINIINFNIINLTYGHDEGDIIFKELSQKIKSLISKNEKLFRITDSQFVIYAEGYNNKEYLIEICNKINLLFESKSQYIPNNISARIGIIEIDKSCDDTDEILRDVEIAASDEFTDSNRIYRFFNNVMEKKILRERHIEYEIRKSLENENNKTIYLEYQPQLDLKTHKITGFEGLARMRSDKLGQVSPVEFIDIAEKRNLIIPLGLKLLKTACFFIKCIEKQGYANVTVAVNISAIQILRDDFYSSVMSIINETKISPNFLEIELTESVFVDNYEILNNNIMNLKNAGIKISLDDFGTGYSSLARIKELNIDIIKIDKLFIDNLITSKPNEIITGDIISFAHRMGLTTVAEGVEHEEQKDYLTNEGCDIMQGYLFSKALSHDEAIHILNKTNN